MSNARKLIKATVERIRDRAAEAHAEGMELVSRATRLDMIERSSSDKQCEDLVRSLVTEGLLSDSSQRTNARGGSG